MTGKPNISEKALANFRRCKADFVYYASLNLKIKDKAGGLVPLALNAAQRYAHGLIEKQLKDTGMVRCLILKGRQQGLSTYTEARFYWRTTLNKGKQAYILTHEQAATDNLFGMVQRYHEHSMLKPHTGASNAKELNFDLIDSGYKVGTAGSKAVGRSGTLQFFHGSECAHWPNAQSHIAGVMQSIADADGTEIILESTANGIGGVFYDMWQAAERKEGNYIPIFIPWFWQPEYRKQDPLFKPDAKEQRLANEFGLDNAQLAWRRAKIVELRSEQLFDQEYPNTAEIAFITSGRTVFDMDLLKAALANCFSPIKRMALVGKRWEDRPDGELRVWFEPRPNHHYVIGGDVAEGLIHGDYSCLDVLELPEGTQVAQWHGHTAPDTLAGIAQALAVRYNKAYVGIESNNHGLTTLIKLRDLGYPNIYARRDVEDRGSGDKETKKIGWLTTTKTKPMIIDNLNAELREKTHGIACKETIAEMMTYIVEENGSYNAQTSCYDDRVMARAIAGEMLRAHYAYKAKPLAAKA